MNPSYCIPVMVLAALTAGCSKKDTVAEQRKQAIIDKARKSRFSMPPKLECAAKAVSDKTAQVFIELSLTGTMDGAEADIEGAKKTYNAAVDDLARTYALKCAGDPQTFLTVINRAGPIAFTKYIGGAMILAGR